MAHSPKCLPAPLAHPFSGAQQSAPLLTVQQRRILRLLLQGDFIWEIAEDPGHRTVYDEKRGASRRLTRAVVSALEQQGWIQQRPNTQADRLDSWELTQQGRVLATVPRVRLVR